MTTTTPYRLAQRFLHEWETFRNEAISGSPIHRRGRQDFGADNNAAVLYNAYSAWRGDNTLFFAKILVSGYNYHSCDRRVRGFCFFKAVRHEFLQIFCRILNFLAKAENVYLEA